MIHTDLPWLRDALRDIWRCGCVAHEIRGFSFEKFENHAIARLHQRLSNSAAAVDETSWRRLIGCVPAEDFVLSVAFEVGPRQDLVTVLQKKLADSLNRQFRRLKVPANEAETYAHELTEALLFGAFRKDQTPGLLAYQAKARLGTWLAGVAWNHVRARSRTATEPVRAESSIVAHGADSPDLPTPTSLARDTHNVAATVEGNDLAPVLERALETATQRVPPEDLESFAVATLSRRPHQDLAVRLGIPPSTFSRRKDRAARVISSAAREALIARLRPRDFMHMQHSLDTEQPDGMTPVISAVRRFCRLQLRRIWRLPALKLHRPTSRQ